MNGPVMLAKAKEFSERFNEGSPDASWLQRFRFRGNITFHKITNERGRSDIDGAYKWIFNILPKHLEKYKKHCIYNADETALFFQALPTGGMSIWGQEL